MTGLQILGVLGAAAALGAVAGGAVAVLGTDASAAGDADDALIERLDELQARVNGLRDAVGDSRDALADVRERVVGVELELSHLAARSSESVAGPGAADGSHDAAGAAENALTALSGALDHERVAADAAQAVRQALGQFKEGRWSDLQKRFSAAMKLRGLPEEERWEKATEDLGLTSVQVDELRDAIADFGEARKAAMQEEETTAGEGIVTRFRRIDPEKLRTARTELDRRVDNTLNSEQREAWEEKGYGTALGAGGPRVLAGSVRDGGPGITVISTGIEIETPEKK